MGHYNFYDKLNKIYASNMSTRTSFKHCPQCDNVIEKENQNQQTKLKKMHE